MTDEDQIESRSFYFFAKDYLKSAVYINDGREKRELKLRFSHNVAYYLFVHSIELGLKSFLCAKGMSKKELSTRKYGHNLDNLFQECINHGMNPSAHEGIVIEWLNTFVDDHAFRYLRQGFHSVPSEIDVRRACETILNMAKDACDQR